MRNRNVSKALLQVYHDGSTLGPIVCATLASSPVVMFMFMATILRSGNIRMCNRCLIGGFVVGRQSQS